MKLDRHEVVTADGARRRPRGAKLLFFYLLFLVRLLNLFERGIERSRLHAPGRGLGPHAAPRTDGAPKRLVHSQFLRRSVA